MLVVKMHFFYKGCYQEIRPGRQTISRHACPEKDFAFGTDLKKDYSSKPIPEWFTQQQSKTIINDNRGIIKHVDIMI